MTKRIWYNDKLYVMSIIFSKHAYARIRERCINEDKIIEIIKKGFRYVLENAEDNLGAGYNNNIYAKFTSTAGNFKVLLVAKWYSGLLYISVVTILLDLYDSNNFKRSKKDTKEYLI